MQMSFFVMLVCFFLYTFYTNWRALKAGSGKLVLIMLGAFNLIIFAMYVFHLKLPFPAEWFYINNPGDQ